MRSPWFARLRLAGGHLLVPGRPRGCASLSLRPDIALLERPREHPLGLAWGTVGSDWALAFRHPRVDVVVRSGPLKARLPADPSGWDDERRVPLRASPIRPALARAEGDTLAALVQVLGERPDVRERLWDLERVAGLAADLRRSVLVRPDPGVGVTRTSLEVIGALRRRDLLHRHGRPVPGDPVRPTEDVVAVVRAELDGNPHCRDIDVPDGLLRRFVSEYVTEVEPWPFGALTA